MAAHPYTMLKEMSSILATDNKQSECRLIAHAMMYTQQADYIWEMLDIYDLASHEMADTLKRFIDAILPKYESCWNLLDQPRTWEDWYQRMTSLKTRAKGKWNEVYHESFRMWGFMTEQERVNWHHVYPE